MMEDAEMQGPARLAYLCRWVVLEFLAPYSSAPFVETWRVACSRASTGGVGHTALRLEKELPRGLDPLVEDRESQALSRSDLSYWILHLWRMRKRATRGRVKGLVRNELS